MQARLSAFLNLLGLSLVLAVNVLANLLPINGYNTGQVSGFYPNYFVPAGFTFGIWGVIYFLLIGFVVCSIIAAVVSTPAAVQQLLESASPIFQLTCLLNAAWIVAWHYLFLGASVVVMLVFLVMLVRLYRRIKPLKHSISSFYRLCMYHSFVVYLAWISVATIANFTALFVGLGWQGEPLSPQTWAFMLVCVGWFLGVYVVGRLKEPAFGFVIVWAFSGIYANQVGTSRLVGMGAAFAACFILALTITILVRTRKIVH